jgi:hypothetical protein
MRSLEEGLVINRRSHLPALAVASVTQRNESAKIPVFESARTDEIFLESVS